jgi:hypothetical protein
VKIASVVSILVMTTLGVSCGFILGRKTASKSEPPGRLHDYCAAVAAAMIMDADDLANGSENRKLAASMRFGEQVTYHSEQEISLCSLHSVDFTRRDTCMIHHDYVCLAKLAHAAAAATKP